MTMAHSATEDHPSPHRGAVKPWLLMAGLAAGPFGWIVQLLVDYALSGELCRLDRGAPVGPPSQGHSALLIGLNLVCLAIAVGGLFVSWRCWRKVQGEKPGGADATLSIGEGRSRFLATAGMMAAGAFTVAILFNTVEPLMIPPCWNPAA